MRILFYYESLAIGGQQTQTLNIIRYFNPEHEIFFTYHQDGDLRPAFEESCTVLDLGVPINVPNLKSMISTMVKSVPAMCKIIAKNNIDVVISGSGYGSVVAGLAAKYKGIAHHRNLGCSLVLCEQLLYKYYTICRFDSLIGKYYGIEAIFEELRAKNVKEHKFIDVSHGVNIEKFQPSTLEKRLEVRESLNIPKNQLVIGWVGRIAANMQIRYSVDMAINLVERGFKDFVLLIVGGGPGEKDMLEKISRFNLESNVIYLGWQPMDRIPDLFAAMDIVPLLEDDPMGGSIIREAMACGKVVMTVDGESGAQSDWIEHLNNGVLVGPENFVESAADWCIKLSKDEELMEKIRKSGRAYAVENMDYARQSRIIEAECLKSTSSE